VSLPLAEQLQEQRKQWQEEGMAIGRSAVEKNHRAMGHSDCTPRVCASLPLTPDVKAEPLTSEVKPLKILHKLTTICVVSIPIRVRSPLKKKKTFSEKKILAIRTGTFSKKKYPKGIPTKKKIPRPKKKFPDQKKIFPKKF